MRKRTALLSIEGATLGCPLICAIALVVAFNIKSPYVQNAEAFLYDVIEGREDAALLHLSPALRAKVQRDCPSGMVTKCIQRLISPSWGKIDEIQVGLWEPSYDSLLLYAFWSNRSAPHVTIVFLTNEENGRWVINGWRGFYHTQGDDEDSRLVHNLQHDNEFIALP